MRRRSNLAQYCFTLPSWPTYMPTDGCSGPVHSLGSPATPHQWSTRCAYVMCSWPHSQLHSIFSMWINVHNWSIAHNLNSYIKWTIHRFKLFWHTCSNWISTIHTCTNKQYFHLYITRAVLHGLHETHSERPLSNTWRCKHFCVTCNFLVG